MTVLRKFLFLLTLLEFCCNADGGMKSPKPPSPMGLEKSGKGQNSVSDAGLLLCDVLHRCGRQAAGTIEPARKLAPRTRPLSLLYDSQLQPAC